MQDAPGQKQTKKMVDTVYTAKYNLGEQGRE